MPTLNLPSLDPADVWGDINNDNLTAINTAVDDHETRLAALEAGRIWVDDYGTAHNGSTNDRTAIQAAIDAAELLDSTVQFGPYSYALKTTTTYTAGLTAVGPLLLRGYPGKTILTGDATSSDGLWMLMPSGSDVTIEGITFEVPNITDAVAVMLDTVDSATRLTLRNCRFLTPRSGGFRCHGSITDLLITECEFNGVGSGVELLNPTGGSGARIIGNSFHGGTGWNAIQFDCPSSTNPYSRIVIANNVIDGYLASGTNNGNGVSLARVRDAVVANNQISNGQRGIHVEDESRDITIHGNVVRDMTWSGIDVQFLSGLTIDTITIQGNTVRNTCTSPGGSLGNGAIETSSGAAGLYGGAGRNINIIGNICEGNAQAGIWTYESRYANISHNTCRNNGAEGIRLTTFTGSVVNGNLCTDSRAGGSKTQTYGFSISGDGTDAIVVGNMFKGNATASTNGTGIGETMPAGSNVT